MKFREIQVSEQVVERLNKEIAQGNLVTGPWIRVVEDGMKDLTKSQEVVAVSSGTMALKIALDTLGVGPGDFVVVPDITFIACASVVQELGAKPVFVDVDAHNGMLSQKETTEMVIGNFSKIKAIIAVRLAGEEVPEWVFKLGVPVIVDSAHVVGVGHKEAFATIYSFHPSKMVSGAEGGAIALHSASHAATARSLRLFGFKEGTREAVMLGYKGNMTNLSAVIIAHGLAQLGAIILGRSRVMSRYNAKLEIAKETLGYYMVTVDDPDAVCAAVPAIRHYPKTLSEQIVGVAMCPRAKWVADHLVSVPMHEFLEDGDVDVVCDILRSRLITYQDQHGESNQGSSAVQ